MKVSVLNDIPDRHCAAGQMRLGVLYQVAHGGPHHGRIVIRAGVDIRTVEGVLLTTVASHVAASMLFLELPRGTRVILEQE